MPAIETQSCLPPPRQRAAPGHTGTGTYRRRRAPRTSHPEEGHRLRASMPRCTPCSSPSSPPPPPPRPTAATPRSTPLPSPLCPPRPFPSASPSHPLSTAVWSRQDPSSRLSQLLYRRSARLGTRPLVISIVTTHRQRRRPTRRTQESKVSRKQRLHLLFRKSQSVAAPVSTLELSAPARAGIKKNYIASPRPPPFRAILHSTRPST
ncbi:hypothetical protein DFH27DRAFT_101502 [Peziza echinospora]|nr:hypothetical protein DFH27DRAFT_101502 [Peziza echinospora]